VAAGLFIYLQMTTGTLLRDIDGVNSYLNAQSTKDQVAQTVAAQERAKNMQTQADTIAIPIENSATYPDLSADDIRRVYDIAGVDVTVDNLAYDRLTGALTFVSSCDYVNGVPLFVAHLRSSGIFSDVSYSGYAKGGVLGGSTRTGSSSSSSAADAVYTFSVSCAVNPPQARVAQAEAAAAAAEQTDQTNTDQAEALQGDSEPATGEGA
jgi:hypothetical protein